MSTRRKRVRSGELLYAEGDPPTTAWLIEQGHIEFSVLLGGNRHSLGEVGPGNLVGEMAVLEAAERTTSARALSDCVLMPIDRELFLARLAAADPIVRELLMSQIARNRAGLIALDREHGAAFAQDGQSARGHNGAGEADESSREMVTPAGVGAFAKIRLENELRSALDRSELDVRLQPIEEIATGRIAGYEALIRWQHSTRGDVSPTEFIRLAEETSLIVPIGDYVLARVCEILVELRQRDSEPLPFIALNVSARQLDDIGLVERIQHQLRLHELPEHCLGIEITESLVLDRERVARLLDQCHAAGMRVSLDDFGAGYSNLSILSTLQFDHIKLDQSFMPTLAQPRGAALVGAMVAMTEALGSDVIVEGVETAEQHAILGRLGCRYAQGWFVGMPQTVDEVVTSRLQRNVRQD